MSTPDHFHHYLSQLQRLHEEMSKEERARQEREIKAIIDTCRIITKEYINLLHNRRIKDSKLEKYIEEKIKPPIKYLIKQYLEKTTETQKSNFENYLTELLASLWLEEDKEYWETEVKKLVSDAVKSKTVNLQDLGNISIAEGGSTIKEPRAGITSDMSGRWTINAFDTDTHNKKETPGMKEEDTIE